MNRVQIRFIKDALDQQDKLSEWEANFVNDLADKPEGHELSAKQNKILNQIQRKLD